MIKFNKFMEGFVKVAFCVLAIVMFVVSCLTLGVSIIMFVKSFAASLL